MPKLPKLYPNHRHQWVQADFPDADDGPPHMARCTVCDFRVPWRLTNLDGAVAQIADNIRQAHEFEETARQVEAIINQPEQEHP